MSGRTASSPLPPPPPPAELRSWPDREAMLADRAVASGVLVRRLLGGGRLVGFLAWTALLELGWGMVGVLLIALGEAAGDPLTVFVDLLIACLGAGVLVPAVWLTARGVRRDRVVRERLVAWAVLDRHGPTDARLRAPGLSVCWMLLSAALCGLGLVISFAVPAGTTREDGGYGFVAYGMGAGLILWINGLIGLHKAVTHYRLAVRLRTPVAAPVTAAVTAPPAARSASSAPPRPE
ncbi:hypothetical protein ABZV60_07145 [Streptomyces sp. NPDC004787]|uniref:hypothetical protein n=1 Tax=Streptomyces sp. NPDC004787 TaxID=3154291 RepID=UPI0033A5742B